MSTTKVHQMRTGRKHFLGNELLKMGGLVFLSVFMILLGSFVAAAPSMTRITIGTFFPHYSPKFVQVRAGTSISWKNPRAAFHSITHEGCTNGQGCAFDSGANCPNRTFSIDHLPPGYYPYHCSFHPIIRGVLVVLESDLPTES